MNWSLEDRGFLPNDDPLETIGDSDFSFLEQHARELPLLVDSGKYRESTSYVNCFFGRKNFSLSEFIDCENHAKIERAFMLFSYMASAWIHSKDYRGKIAPDY